MNQPYDRLDLVDVISDLGEPPVGVDLETYAIAEVDPSELSSAIKTVTPGYYDLEKIHDENPDLYEEITTAPQPEWRLGEAIEKKRERLSRARRLAATALVSLTFFTGLGAFTYHAKQEIRQDLPSLRKDHNDKEYEILTSAAGGVAGGAVGGVITYMVGLGLAGRLARRPAQKKVRQAALQSGT